MLVESSNPAHSLADSQRMREALRGARAGGRHRRRDDRDRAAAPTTCCPRRPSSRSGRRRSSTSSSRTTSSTCATRCSSRCRARCPSPRSTPGWCGRSASSTTPSWRRCARAAARGPRGLRAGVPRGRRRRTRRWAWCCRSCSTRRSGPTLPDGLAGAAALWGLAQTAAMTYPDAVRRAGHADGDALFDAILASRSGVTFTVDEYEDDFELITHADQQDRARDPRAARRAPRAARRARRAARAPSSRSCCRPASAAPTPPTHLPRPDVAQARRRRRAAGQPRGRRGARPGRRRPRAHHHRGGQRRGHASRSATRCCPGTRRCPTASASTTPTATAATQVPGVAPNELTSTGLARRRSPARRGTSTCRRGSRRCPVALSTASAHVNG